MKLHFYRSLDAREKADILIVPFWKKEGVAEIATLDKEHELVFNRLIDLGDFSGKEKELSLVYDFDRLEPRVLLLGLGFEQKCHLELIRRAYAEAYKFASKKGSSINICTPWSSAFTPDEVLAAIIEASLLSDYEFSYKQEKDDKKVKKISFITSSKKDDVIEQEVRSLVSGVNLTRSLVNGNADDITPFKLAQTAKELEDQYEAVKVQTYNREQLEKLGMGLFAAVARSSPVEPYFVVIEYNPSASKNSPIVFVGKGVTYDTGGLSIKPSSSMDTMKCDMAGAGTVIGLIKTIAELKLQLHVVGIFGATENSIGPTSYKLGDVYQAYNKKSVEIKNTDAEGRLVLADCLAWAAQNLKPTVMIDLATLTGAAGIALGDVRSPLFSNDENLAKELFLSGEATGEKVWQMPLDDEYQDLLPSKIADYQNYSGREGGLVFSAMFLKEFVKETPWAHLDIAYTAYLSKPRYYHKTLATGYGIRLLINYLRKCHVQSC